MQEFRVEFTKSMNGERKYLKEIVYGENAQDAVNVFRFWNDCASIRIVKAYRSRNRRWEITEAWE